MISYRKCLFLYYQGWIFSKKIKTIPQPDPKIEKLFRNKISFLNWMIVSLILNKLIDSENFLKIHANWIIGIRSLGPVLTEISTRNDRAYASLDRELLGQEKLIVVWMIKLKEARAQKMLCESNTHSW